MVPLTLIRKFWTRKDGHPRTIISVAMTWAMMFTCGNALAYTYSGPGTRPAPRNIPGCESLLYKEPTFDYRLREAGKQEQRDYKDRTVNHYEPAAANMQKRQGEPQIGVLTDIDYVLRSWPNHQPALLLLANYYLRGGKQWNYSSFDCYVKGAKLFAADDVAVSVIEGFYYQKLGDAKRATAAYQQALAIDPNAAEANYNLGLVYFGQGDYSKARAHAQRAYASGYPLPTLRENLKRIGQW